MNVRAIMCTRLGMPTHKQLRSQVAHGSSLEQLDLDLTCAESHIDREPAGALRRLSSTGSAD